MLRRRCPRCSRIFAGSERFCSNDATELVDVEVEDPRVGTTLAGRYRVQEPLGRGGMGVVYRAEQLPIERPVAAKIVRHDHDRLTAARFLREAHAMSRLQSPHTVRLFDFGEHEDGALYLIMELLTGENLRARLDRGPLPVAEVLRVLDEVAASLSEAHAHGIVHRDLKPENVFLCEIPGEPRLVKVLDFGIASLPPVAGQRLTTTGEIPGTPAYVAPERVSGEDTGPPADVYALGVLAHELLTGHPPLSGDTPWDVLMAHLSEDPPPLAERAPAGVTVPAALEELVWGCLAKAPALRPRDASAFREALRRVPRGPAAEAPAPRAQTTTERGWRPPRRRRRAPLLFVIAGALALGVAGGWLARGSERPPTQEIGGRALGDLATPGAAPIVTAAAEPPEAAQVVAPAAEPADEERVEPGLPAAPVVPADPPRRAAPSGPATSPRAAPPEEPAPAADSADPEANEGPDPALIERLLGDD